PADRRRELVSQRDLHAEPRAHALPVAGDDVLPLRVRLVVEALVAVADVAEEGRPPEPVAERCGLLGLGARGPGADRRLVRLLLRLLRDLLLVVDLPAERLQLLLGLLQLLLENPEPPLRRALRE